MRATDFQPGYPGQLEPQAGGAVAFIPDPLPPRDLKVSFSLMNRGSKADVALAHLNGIATTLKNPEILVRPFLRLEALESNRIEGTQTTYSDLVLFEAASSAQRSAADPDKRVVANYMTALNYGLDRCRELPISRRLISDVHGVLMKNYMEHRSRPGQFRNGQVVIGDKQETAAEARFVPPPADRMPDLFSDLERFLNTDDDMPLLIKTALVHYQFETIHPFWDGNGRVGRLLISLMICNEGALFRPMLYLSGYFESRRREYYDRLLAVSQKGDWEGWVCFFLDGVRHQANDAVGRISNLQTLREEYIEKLSARKGSATSNLKLLDLLFESQVVTVPMVHNSLGLTPPSARECIERLVEAGVLERLKFRYKSHLWYAPRIMSAINPGPIPGADALSA